MPSIRLRAAPARSLSAAAPRASRASRPRTTPTKAATEPSERAPRASSIKTDSAALIRVVSTTRAAVAVRPVDGAADGTDLRSYLRLSPEFVGGLDLPLGASITRTADRAFEISLPKLELFDVVVQPTAYSTVT
jgi:hypothetical protein